MTQIISTVLVKYRNYFALASLLLTVLLTLGAKNLYLNTNYNIFFDADDSRKLAHEAQQAEFTKTDNLVLLIKPLGQESIFTQNNLLALKWITEEAWQAPFSIRVDSLTNFQHSFADREDLVVKDLVDELNQIAEPRLAQIRKTALGEARLINRFISADGRASLINVSVELPEYPAESLKHAERVGALLSRDNAIREVNDFGQKLKRAVTQRYPNFEVHLLGETVINQSLADASDKDAATLIPLMFFVIVLILGLLLRSVVSIFASLSVIVFSILASVGLNGWLGGAMNMVNMVAPIIILTIAVCDSVHVLSNYVDGLARELDPIAAMEQSLRINLQPVLITSITTAVGFITLNFSPSPPFQGLGNLCAFGVMYAMLLTLFLLPAISVKFLKRASKSTRAEQVTQWLAQLIIDKKELALVIATCVTVVALVFVPKNNIDDDPSLYFKPSNAYRSAVDFSQTALPGINDINFSLNCGSPNCIYQPSFLRNADEFEQWLLNQPKVEAVIGYVHVIKKINANFNNDELEAYVIPSSAEQIAQYNLLYELSLPYGLDLNTLVNFDKSSIRISAFTRQTSTAEFLAIESNASEWLNSNASVDKPQGNSIRIMFAALGENNIRGMLWGALAALIGVTLTILISLRSMRYSVISMIANSFPALIAIGIWGMFVAHINMAVAVVFSITLGIIVDDSVHFISKYRFAREQKNLTPNDAVHYAFQNVGNALFVTTLVLAIGFGLLCFSDFNLNSYLGALTAITVITALVFDYLVLPPLLMIFDKEPAGKSTGIK